MAAVKNFRISRASSASSASRGDASHDPFTKLVFEPALESDELFDALREAYPAVKTHTERKKQAVLDFLMDERQAIEQEITAFVHGTGAAAPVDAAFNPQDDASPLNPPSVRNPSTSYSGDESFSSSAAPSSAESSPETLSLKQMTSVWTASGDAPPKIHHRRSMTTKEKEEYRKRRQMKACQDCRSRKRKCNHDAAAAAASSRVTSKVKKRSKAPQHNTPSESSFQLEGSSVWGEPSLLGSVMESPLNFTDFGPPPPAGIEGFEDFLLLPEDDEFSMAFSPDPLFSTATTMAPQNNTFPYTYAEPQQPTHSFALHQSYAQSFGSNSSASASAYSSPGRAMAPAHASIAPAHMIQSSQNWDMDLAGVGVNMDLGGGSLHGHAPVPMVDILPSGGSRGNDATLHNEVQPEPSRGRRRAAAAATSSSGLCQRPLPHPGAQPMLTASDPAQTHSCEGVGTPLSAAFAANTPASTHTSNGNSPTVLANNTSSSSAPATGLVCYVPSPTTTRTARCAAGGTASSQNSDSASISGTRTGRAESGTAVICNSTVRSDRDLGRNVLCQPGAAAQNTTQPPPVLASPVSSTQFSASFSTGGASETAAQLPTTELQRSSASASASGSLRAALANSTASTILLSVVVVALVAFSHLPAVTTATTLTRSPELTLALTSVVFFALSSLAGSVAVVDRAAPSPGFVDAPRHEIVSAASTSALRSRLRVLGLGMPKLSKPLTSEKTIPTPRCKAMSWGVARAMSLV
ncbi:hypothetical protein IWX90DRAFT_412514 [Phyllosticta citrichinensis]|uniref:Uncharacterized protein n=1 Tax=Phyllosticta citrichinensis TaxID=1130410 RepID=A0ABR1Y4E9_9PEZI